MQKIIFLFTISFLILSCGNPSQKESSTDYASEQASSVKDQSHIGRNNYAVTWKWATTNSQLVSDNSPAISKELVDLWKKDIVENVYYDSESPVDKLHNFPNIAFFLKAHSDAEAKSILNELTVVTKGIATYKLHPVGQLWLDRKSEVIHKKGMTKSFVAVWTTVKSPLKEENADKLLKSQSDTVLELWNEGIVENVYFDIEGTYSPTDKTDFVFFVNANTEAEAKGHL